MRPLIRMQLASEIGNQPLGLGSGPRHGISIQQPRNLSALGKVGVLVPSAHSWLGILSPTIEKIHCARDMNPCQQARIGRPVRFTVGQSAADMFVDRLHSGYCPFGQVAVSVSGDGDEARGAAEPTELIFRNIAMIPHPGERAGMKHLGQKRGDAADHH